MLKVEWGGDFPSGGEGGRAPGFNSTLRVGFRVWSSAPWHPSSSAKYLGSILSSDSFIFFTLLSQYCCLEEKSCSFLLKSLPRRSGVRRAPGTGGEHAGAAAVTLLPRSSRGPGSSPEARAGKVQDRNTHRFSSPF